jgi:RHS repeat-associated protein
VRDGLSRLVTGIDNDSVAQLRYDSLGALIVDEVNGLRNMALSDGRGREIATLNAAGRLTTRTFDTTGRLRSVDSGGTNLASYDYVGPERISRRDHGNGTWTVDAYDGARRITSLADRKFVSGVETSFDNLSFGWDQAGNKTSWIDLLGLGNSRVMAYDSANRMTSAVNPSSGTSQSFTFDRAGNRTSATGGSMPGTYVLNATLPVPADKQVNQYTSTPAGAMTYSDRGTTSSLVRSTGQLLFQYDYRGQLVSAVRASGALGETYTYDALGRRISRTVTTGSSTTHHVYSHLGRRVLAEGSLVNGVLGRVMEYAHAVMLDEVVTMWTNGAPHWFPTDDLYSVTCLTDSAGNVVERYRYDVAGDPTVLAPSGAVLAESVVGNTRMYQSLPFDAGTGLYNNRARYYDPRSGRFLSEDPLGVYHDEMALGNGKTRSGNNAWSMLDPTGYQSRRPSDVEPGTEWLEWALRAGAIISAPFSWPLSLSFGIHWAFLKWAAISGDKRWCAVEVTQTGEGGPAVGEKLCYVCPSNTDGKCPKTVELVEWDGVPMNVKFKSLNEVCTDDCGFMVLDIYPILREPR